MADKPSMTANEIAFFSENPSITSPEIVSELCRLALIGLAHDGGWVEWSGRGKPVFDDDRIFVRSRSGSEFAALGGAVRWSHDGRAHDIIAYRIAPPSPNQEQSQ